MPETGQFKDGNKNNDYQHQTFTDQLKQNEVTYLFMQLLKIKEELLDKTFCCKTAPNNSDDFDLMEISDYSLVCTVHWSFGIRKKIKQAKLGVPHSKI